jgi:hypothetical protein
MFQRLGYPWVHRLEQWDLACWPIVCIHWRTPNRCKRIFCLWRIGVQIGNWRWIAQKRSA